MSFISGKTRNTTTLAIVGGGPGGVALIFYLSLFADKLHNTTILLFERQSTIGAGTPHGDPSESLLVNMILSAHSVHPFDPNHFLNWLRLKFGWVSDDPVPRYWFGQYLSECHLEAVEHLRSFGVQVHTICSEVAELLQGDPEMPLRLRTSAGNSYLADYVFLALGHQGPSIPESLLTEINHA